MYLCVGAESGATKYRPFDDLVAVKGNQAYSSHCATQCGAFYCSTVHYLPVAAILKRSWIEAYYATIREWFKLLATH